MAKLPISFSPSMALALHLDRKDQTRRLLKSLLKFGNVKDFGRSTTKGYHWQFRDQGGRLHDLKQDRLFDFLPYSVGDLLYVREAIRGEGLPGYFGIGWEADDVSGILPEDMKPQWEKVYRYRGLRGAVVPAMHAPRWSSRLTLRVTKVRVEELLDITAADAKAEGLACLTKDNGRTWKYGLPDRDGLPGTDNLGWPWHEWCQDPIKAYLHLWDKLNARRGFGSHTNPWVIVYEFEVIAENIDRIAA